MNFGPVPFKQFLLSLIVFGVVSSAVGVSCIYLVGKDRDRRIQALMENKGCPE